MTLSILRIRRPPKSNLPLGMDALCKISILIIIISSAAISYQRSRVNVDRYFKPQNLDIGVHDQIPCHQSKYLRLARSRTVWKQFLFGPAAVLNTKWCSVSSKFGQRVGVGRARGGLGVEGSHKMRAINSLLCLDFITTSRSGSSSSLYFLVSSSDDHHCRYQEGEADRRLAENASSPKNRGQIWC